ncbi:Rrf2 family transcriptional regulator [Oxalobacter vibrioformis]|uniref:Rrf2 family transcriptional regulator n=1 Tax=Oxalobacter vibrioformis TaxID=933080 RepID=A0A9E9LU14_9BURK|nr:Rrf2 family transcriptional regulator [Oxalobacter vibrioformis]WAW09620.1 Rrf2 family transcriptional regulator [Oxalobacter vibrioformis]
MRLSANTRYAIRVIFELALAEGPLPIPALSEKAGIAQRTVENIHTVLRQHDITASTIGAKGGIHLAMPLSRISLGRMVTLFDDGVEFAVCFGNKSNDCPRQLVCDTRSVWGSVSNRIQQELDAVSLDSILTQYRREEEREKPIFIHGINR